MKVKVISEVAGGREKVEEVESILPGTKSVLNINQEMSALHVGGFPTSAGVQVRGRPRSPASLSPVLERSRREER